MLYKLRTRYSKSWYKFAKIYNLLKQDKVKKFKVYVKKKAEKIKAQKLMGIPVAFIIEVAIFSKLQV